MLLLSRHQNSRSRSLDGKMDEQFVKKRFTESFSKGESANESSTQGSCAQKSLEEYEKDKWWFQGRR